ncbi:MAG: DM13 domain-containing protein [Cyanobacteria bacterium J06621_12]
MQRLSLTLTLTLIVATATSCNVFAADKTQPLTQSDSSVAVAKAAASTQFVAVEHPTVGQVSIVEADGKKYLEIGQDFQSDRGPDLKVILHQANAVDLKVREGDYLNLGALQAFSGAQRYLIPDSVDLANYKSVAIWCEQFNATFGYAPLAQ